MKTPIPTAPSRVVRPSAVVAAMLVLSFASIQAQEIWYAPDNASPWNEPSEWSSERDGTGDTPSSIDSSNDLFHINSNYAITGVHFPEIFDARLWLNGDGSRIAMKSDRIEAEGLILRKDDPEDGLVSQLRVADEGTGLFKAVFDAVTVDESGGDVQFRLIPQGADYDVDLGLLSGSGGIFNIGSENTGVVTVSADDTSGFEGRIGANTGTLAFEPGGSSLVPAAAGFPHARLTINESNGAEVRVSGEVLFDDLSVDGNLTSSGAYSGSSLESLSPAFIDDGGTLYLGRSARRFYAGGSVNPWRKGNEWFKDPDGSGSHPGSVNGSGGVFVANSYPVISSDSKRHFGATLQLNGFGSDLIFGADSLSVDRFVVNGELGLVNTLRKATNLDGTEFAAEFDATELKNSGPNGAQLRVGAPSGVEFDVDFGALSGEASVFTFDSGSYVFSADDASAYTGRIVARDGSLRFGPSENFPNPDAADFRNSILRIVEGRSASVLLDRDLYVEKLELRGDTNENIEGPAAFEGSELTDLSPAFDPESTGSLHVNDFAVAAEWSIETISQRQLSRFNRARWWTPITHAVNPSDSSEGGTYLAFLSPNDKDDYDDLVVAERGVSGTWTVRDTGRDVRQNLGHTQPSLAIDGEGYLHVFANMHNFPKGIQYSRSNNPYSVDAGLGTMRSPSAFGVDAAPLADTREWAWEGLYTYPVLASAGQTGDLFMLIRDRNDYLGDGSVMHKTEFYQYDASGREWGKGKGPLGDSYPFVFDPKVLDWKNDAFDYTNRTAYPQAIHAGPKGDIHMALAWSPRGTGHKHKAWYARFDPETERFFRADGRPYPKNSDAFYPLSEATSDIFQPLESGEPYRYDKPGILGATLTVDSRGRPMVAYIYAIYESDGTFKHYEHRIARWKGDEWSRETMATGFSNVSQNLWVTHSDGVLRYYGQSGDGPTDVTMRLSYDDGETWTDPVKLTDGRNIMHMVGVTVGGSDYLYLPNIEDRDNQDASNRLIFGEVTFEMP